VGTANEWTIYHNPRCSKSRAALEYLAEKGVKPRVVEYLKTPLDVTALNDLLRRLDANARDILRDGEDEYERLGLNNPTVTREELLNAVAGHPVLLQRPIVVRGERAVIGRPTEAIDALLDD
jgi:arsenate reductase